MRRKIFQKRIYREDLQANPEVFYLFGDNLEQVGMGGQAGEMRGEPNAIGVPTKKAPASDDADFFSDAVYDANCKAIGDALGRIPDDSTVVIPLDGLGTGLAELDKRAPETFAFLELSLRVL